MLRATFLVPVQVGIAGKPPKPGRDGRMPLPQTKISFALLSTTDKRQYFMAFTDWDELHKWRKDPAQQTMMMRFDDYATLLAKTSRWQVLSSIPSAGISGSNGTMWPH